MYMWVVAWAGLAPAGGLRTAQKEPPGTPNLWLPNGAPIRQLPNLQAQTHTEVVAFQDGQPLGREELVAKVLRQDKKVEEQELEDLSIISEQPLENQWVTRGRNFKVYVYSLPTSLQLAFDDGQSSQDFIFDRAIARLFTTSAQRVRDPDRADFYFVDLNLPEMLNAQLFGQGQVPADVDVETVRVMREVGPYWDTRRNRHVLMTRRCPGSDFDMDSNRYPQLLERDVLCLCLETGEHVDQTRALHVGYYVQALDPLRPLPLMPVNRPMLATFMGAPINSQREAVEAWMSKCSDCAAFMVSAHGEPSTLSDSTITDYHTVLAHSRFGVEPFGDTPERMSRDADWALGAVPVIFDRADHPQLFLPWQPIVNWSDFSVTFSLTEKEQDWADFTPRLERMLRSLVSSGEADRLYGGVLRARRQLRWTHYGVFSTIMGMLAWRTEQGET